MGSLYYYFMDLNTKNRSCNLLLAVYFVLLPFVFLSSILDPFLLARQLFTGVTLLITLLFCLKNKALTHFSFDRTALLYLGFIAFCIISFSKAQIQDLSHITLSKYLIFLIFFLVLRQLLVADAIKAETIKSYVIVFGLLSIVIALLAFVNKSINGQHVFRYVHAMSGTFGNKNFLSSILFFCLPFYFIGISMSKKIRIASIIAIIISITLLLALRTRAVMIALGFFLIMAVLFQIKKRYSARVFYWSLAAPAVLIVIGIACVIALQGDLHSSYDIRQQYFYRLLSSETLFSRIEFWKHSVYIISDNFFSGIGIGNWANIHPKYGLDHFTSHAIINGRMILTNPHNDFFMVFSEIGVFGFLCYIGIFASMLYQAFWLSKNETNSIGRRNAAYFLFFIIGYMIVAFFDFPLTRIEHQVILLTVFSIISAQYIKTKKPKVLKIRPRLFYILGCIALVYCSAITFFRIKGERNLFHALEAEKQSAHETSVFEFKKTKNSFVLTDNFAIPVDWHIGKALYNQGLFEESLQHYNEAYKINPYSLVVNNDLASNYIKIGNTEQAIRHYNEALAISPAYEDARINLASVYFNNKQYENAFQTIDSCNVNTKNKLYKQALTVIVESKLNATLVKINNKELNSQMISRIKTPEQLLELYFVYKKNKTTFEEYLLSLIN